MPAPSPSGKFPESEARALLARLDDEGVIQLWALVMAELNKRAIVRSDNNPLGDYCEFLVAAHYSVKPEGNSQAGHDVTAPDGIRIQVKGRRMRANGRKPGSFSVVRNLFDEPPPFDILIGLIINRDFSVRDAWEIPIERVRAYAVYRKHTNGWTLPTINGAMQADPAIKQIKLRHAP